MAECNAECIDSFGIEDLLDFSNEEIEIGEEDAMQLQQQESQSADSSVTAENFSSRVRAGQQQQAASIKPAISLIDRDFTVPTPAVDFEWLISGFGSDESGYGGSSSSNTSSSKFLLGSAREEAEKEGLGFRRGVGSPISVLESSATSLRPAMISVSTAPAAAPARSKRGRPITPSTRILLSSSSSYGDNDAEEELEEDDEDDDEEDATEEEASDEEEEDEEEEASMESDCALSTESEVLTEEDFRPAKRLCPAVRGGHPAARVARHVVRGPMTGVTAGGDDLAERRCTHCQTQKTPQWRAGPMGPKTLCNACGVRFKSGRLLPEYRPAGSPSFSSDRHSNSHRKVLEMRRIREAGVMRRLKAEAEAEIGEILEA